MLSAVELETLRASNPLPDVMRRSGLALTPSGAEFKALCCFHKDNTPSLTVYPCSRTRQWRYKCFACQANGDVFDFIQEFYTLDFKQAVEHLGGALPHGTRLRQCVPVTLDVDDVYEGVTPIPARDHPFSAGANVTIYNPKRAKDWSFVTSHVFEYRSAAGDLLGVVLRQNINDRKITPTVRFVRLPDGREVWAAYPFTENRPLYGLHRLKPDGLVIVVEGEKACDALQAHAPASVVTWGGGCNAYLKTDWTPLAGRNVLLFPDADAAGYACMIHGYMKDDDGRVLPLSRQKPPLALHLQSLGCNVKFIDVLRCA